MDASRREDSGLTFGLRLSTLLNDELVETKLLSRSLLHTFFNAALSDEAKDDNLFRLSNSVRYIA